MPRELERLLLHPAHLAALLLWAINDHVLKAALHNAWTGKLSDVASLISAPVLLAAATALLGVGRKHPLRLLCCWAGVLALVMTAIKLWEPAGQAYRVGLGALQWPLRCVWALDYRPFAAVSLAADPTDVWTLPAAAVPLLIAWLSVPSKSSECVHRRALCVSVLIGMRKRR